MLQSRSVSTTRTFLVSNQIHEGVPAAVALKSAIKVGTKPAEHPHSDTRSPLERFRTAPKKPLSVTDLVSPAWCELQYWYTLTKHGRKKRTSAMKQGSAVHKVLEDQVHRTVQIDIETKEDAWGLRIWNVIQELRTLRETGQTRELEVWGTIDGLVVNGVIDELSYICPDHELEVLLQRTPKKEKKLPPADQTSISDFFKTKGSMNDDDETIYEDALEEQDYSATGSSQNSMSILLAHNNLNTLWSLMISEFKITFPDGAESLGGVLKAEYRSRDSGEIVGIKTVPMDNEDLNGYLEEELRWWKGEREAKGVVVEEAFKCRSCDFAEECEWRLYKVEEATQKARLRKGRKTSAV
ncbi:hypothetical protein DID88_000172 [Monilinia fructigena]|uniref:Exonuclease V n=1 Tax=Monilinia fructigena TaxID=38457 RepID=A0A395IJC1_9HELO|nr:hypothetical protein DID88_000172 [Monilinia fructigena]